MTCMLADWRQATAKVRAWQRQGARVVFTNGCFDLLHPGHVDYLEKAQALGERLVVGLNDDASVRRLKGPTRPINPLADRARMLGALRCIDLVVPFSEDTPLALIRMLSPDILVKGGDYRVDAIVGADVVRARGGRVVVLPFLAGYSSSALIRRICERCGCDERA
ncbi:MAG: D-glycero-beta-D-manno-heptose 1-phosphate adenylyltransferase [Zetaproteobacteria bacterium]|nr:MAG: D-glycero-beta-D-manno-heptose 1-phosphate adenylyltransferase [Zetaproteobacteria bacterium]